MKIELTIEELEWLLNTVEISGDDENPDQEKITIMKKLSIALEQSN